MLGFRLRFHGNHGEGERWVLNIGLGLVLVLMIGV